MASSDIPTIDVSPFLREKLVEGEKQKAMEQIGEACVNYGFFQIEKHGVPLDLLRRTMEMYKTFFDCSDEDKLLVSPKSGGTVPAGYLKSPPHSEAKNEHFLILPPSSGVNVYPNDPRQFKQVLEEMFPHFTKLGVLLERIISECLGLPPNTLANLTMIGHGTSGWVSITFQQQKRRTLENVHMKMATASHLFTRMKLEAFK